MRRDFLAGLSEDRSREARSLSPAEAGDTGVPSDRVPGTGRSPPLSRKSVRTPADPRHRRAHLVLVPGAGIEPARDCSRRILSPRH